MGIAALDRIVAAGFELEAAGDKLTVTGPRPLTEEQRRFVRLWKTRLLAELRHRQALQHPTVKAALDTFPGATIVDIRDAREERAALIAEGCGVSQPIAEVLADHDLLNDPRNPDAWK